MVEIRRLGLVLVVLTASAGASALTFEERVDALEKVERIRYSHQIGVTKSFEEAIPRELLEARVLDMLKRSASLPITAEMLLAETERQLRASRMPGRLRELYAALDNDSVLIQECLARPALVERLGTAIDADEPLELARPARFPDASLCLLDDTWDGGSLDDVPDSRTLYSAVWTGNVVVVWGGAGESGLLSTGYRYDPVLDSSSPTAAAGAPVARSVHTAVWTGSRMIVWGGSSSTGPVNTGALYDPLGNFWIPTAITGAAQARSFHAAAWTGNRMLVWGGGPTTGGLFDPETNAWSAMSTTGQPSANRTDFAAAWAGGRFVVWGGIAGGTPLGNGARYDPVTNTWGATSTAGAPVARFRHSVVSTGSRMIVWGGLDASNYVDSGGIYDPAANTWSPMSTTGAPSPRGNANAAWTGREMIVWAGDIPFVPGGNSGGRYAPATNTWLPTSTVNAPAGRSGGQPVWTGELMIVPPSHGLTGSRYALGHDVDDDGDGLSECGGDCNDGNPGVRPGVQDHCDGYDNDCNGVVDFATEVCNEFDDDCDGLRNEDANGEDNDGDGSGNLCDNCLGAPNSGQGDSDHDGIGNACELEDGEIYVMHPGHTAVAWLPEAGFTTWNVYAGSLAPLRATGTYTHPPIVCGFPSLQFFDASNPPPGSAKYYLVTGRAGGVESGLGTNSAGVPRPNANPCP